jgi:F-type H+-transporting ATPase subunit d
MPNCRPPPSSLARNASPSPSLRRKLTSHPSQRSAALKLDWTKLGTQLGLKGQTAAALQSFKKRNDDARRKVTILSEQAQTVDFAYYRSVLKNQSIVDDIEKQFNAFKPQTYDVNRQIKAIEAFESQALKSAEETKSVVDKELSDLNKTLKNIEDARPFDDLTVVRTPGLDMDRRGKTNRYCRMRLLPLNPRSTSAPSSSSPRVAGPFQATRRSSAICPFYRCLFPCSYNMPDRLVTPRFVNSSGGFECILDLDHLLFLYASFDLPVSRRSCDARGYIRFPGSGLIA